MYVLSRFIVVEFASEQREPLQNQFFDYFPIDHYFDYTSISLDASAFCVFIFQKKIEIKE